MLKKQLADLNSRSVGAKYLGVSERTLDQWIADDKVKAVRLGRLVKLPIEELLRVKSEGVPV